MSLGNNLPIPSDRTQYFYESGVWVKPQGITMLQITCIGGGGGGGGGIPRTSAQSGGGGGGGGSASISRIIIPAMYLTDTLGVIVGKGGAGGNYGR